jgi:hypothetical protein
MYRKWCGAPGQGGWVEKCLEVREKVLEQERRAEKGPEAHYMLFKWDETALVVSRHRSKDSLYVADEVRSQSWTS